MKIMLIQTPWSARTGGAFKRFSTRFVYYPPMGLLSLASFVEKNGHQADILDLEADFIDFDILCRKIVDSKAGLIGITTSTPIFFIVQSYAKRLKERLNIPIVIGGPHVSVLKEETLSSEFDFAVMNEGEYPLVELMNELGKDKNYSKIKGLIYRENGQIKTNPPRPFIEDLDSLPFPAREKLAPETYKFEVPGKGFVPVASTALTRGCPFKCVFCSEPANSGRKLRMRSPKSVVDEIVEIKEKYGIDHIYLLDSTLTLNRKLIEGFCHELINRKVNITFESQTRANLIDKPLLELMKKAGLVRISFGLESADKNVLKLMRKEINPEDVRNAFRLCRQLHITAITGIMMGNPGDTKKTILDSARFVRSIADIKYAPLAIAIPYPGTELFNMAQKGMHGLKLIEVDYKKYARYAGGVMEIDGMSPVELLRLQRKALIIMHLTPSKILGIIGHFGLINLICVAANMLKHELISRIKGYEPVMKDIADENTTLKSLGLIPAFQSKSRQNGEKK